jgi:hypothetical protein
LSSHDCAGIAGPCRGVTLDAKAKKIKIIRKKAQKTLQFPFNYKDVKNGRTFREQYCSEKR